MMLVNNTSKICVEIQINYQICIDKIKLHIIKKI